MVWLKLSRKFATKIRAMSDLELSAIAENLTFVRDKISAASALRSPELQELFPSPRLVAVSKTKPKEAVIEAYKHGQRHFGENYVQELVEKASCAEVKESCPEIQWHFIGHMQRNKVPAIVSIADTLFVVETVDTEKLATSLNDTLAKKQVQSPLNIFLQVNTSGEESKSGCPPENLKQLVQFVNEKCPKLKLKGLMTIGAIASSAESVNDDFKLLYNLREDICTEFNIERKDLELSMGMSSDFEQAITMGSTNIRVGTTIFGGRQYNKA